MTIAAFNLAQLRHLHQQLHDGAVVDQRGAAVGLLGPAIEQLERFMATVSAGRGHVVTSLICDGCGLKVVGAKGDTVDSLRKISVGVCNWPRGDAGGDFCAGCSP